MPSQLQPQTTPENILSTHFGHSEFRGGQKQIIEHILNGGDVLGIMPTGAGKSICYQIPALMLSGITLVVSPLISLMKDQVNALTQQGIRAAYLNSSLSQGQYFKALQNAADGVYKIIYIAPERLLTESFLNFACAADISMLTIDEAHCVSQWGQDFRPSYLQIPEFINMLPRRPLLNAFTATATSIVQQDIADLLGLHNPYVVVTGFDRENLEFSVLRPRDKTAGLLEFLAERKNENGIVYCATRKAVEQVCDDLNKKGFNATRYHAGLTDEERRQNQDDFIYDRKEIMVATNAFGMGIDKSDVRFVVHYNMPKNMESYYQEAGRAGRDGEKSACLLLYSPGDTQTQKFMIDKSFEENEEMPIEQRLEIRKNDYEKLRYMETYCRTSDCLRGHILRYFGEDAKISCGSCGNCLTQFETMNIRGDAQKIISCVYQIEETLGFGFGKGMIANVLKGSKNERIRRFGLDELESYGTMKSSSIAVIGAVIDFLVMEGYLNINDAKHSVVETTARSADALHQDGAMEMKLPKAERKGRTAASGEKDYDTALFENLRALRLELAQTMQVPAYVVFTDASLRDMCIKKPVTEQAFRTVSGVGEEKARRYAQVFTQAIRDYVDNGV